MPFRAALADLVILLMLAFILLKFVKQVAVPRLDICDGFFLLFMGFSLMGRDVLAYRFVFFTEMIIIAFLYLTFKTLYYSIISSKDYIKCLKYLSKGFLLGLAFNSFILMLGAFEVEWANYFFGNSLRFRGTFREINQLSISLALLFPLSMPVLSFNIFFRAVVYFLLIVNTTAAGSRIAFALCAVSIILVEFFLFSSGRAVSLFYKSVLLIFVFISLFISLSNTGTFRRITGNLGKEDLIEDVSRRENFIQAVETMPYLVTGVGMGCFKAPGRHEVHNLFLCILVEGGIIIFFTAGLAFIYIFGNFFKKTSDTNLKRIRVALFISLFAAFGMSMFHNTLRTRALWAILVLVKSFGFVSQEQQSDQIGSCCRAQSDKFLQGATELQ